MAKVKIQGHASGTGVITLTAPNTSTDRTVTLPDADVTLGVDATKLPLSGGTMTGDLVVSADVDITGSINGTSGALDIKNEANNQNIFIKTTSAGSEITALKIHSGGVLELPSGGLRVGGTAAANTLDDYEEGTWTPTFTCSGGGSYTLDSGANTMAYTKIGRIVHIQGGINIDGESSPNGYLRISLPFTPMTGTDDSDYCEGSASLYNHGGNKPNGIKIFVYGDTHAYFRTIPDNGVGFYLDHGDVDTSFQIRTSFTYIAA